MENKLKKGGVEVKRTNKQTTKRKKRKSEAESKGLERRGRQCQVLLVVL